ncbi:unnamed protein product [Prunus armeniaca]
MAQVALKIYPRKRFDGLLFGDLAELANKASKYEEMLMEEQQKRNSSKGTYYKTPSSSVHLVEVESGEDTEGLEEREIAVAEMAKLKHSISCKALTKPPNYQKPPPFIGGFVPNKPAQNKGYHRGRNNNRRVKTGRETSISYNRPLSPVASQHGQPKLTRTEDRQTNDRSSSRDRRVMRETCQRPKATISAWVVLYSKCKCETNLEVILDKQNQPTPSVFDRIGTSYQRAPAPALSKDRTRQKDYLRPAKYSRRKIEQPKKKIPIKMPGNEKPLATIMEGIWYSVEKVVLPETSSAREGKNPEVLPQIERTTS